MSIYLLQESLRCFHLLACSAMTILILFQKYKLNKLLRERERERSLRPLYTFLRSDLAQLSLNMTGLKGNRNMIFSLLRLLQECFYSTYLLEKLIQIPIGCMDTIKKQNKYIGLIFFICLLVLNNDHIAVLNTLL